jgi:hypothetical protein
MKMNQFRSILAVVTVATSIAASISPAKAFTWNDLWRTVRKGAENTSPAPLTPHQQSNNASNDESMTSLLASSRESKPSASAPFSFPNQPSRSNNNSAQLDNNNTAAPLKVTNPIIRQDDFTFQIVGCRREFVDYYGNTLACIIKIIYVGNNDMKDFSITSARAISSVDGNQYTPFESTVAGQQSVDMIKGQPMRGLLRFKLESGLKRLSVIQIEANNTKSKITFKNKKPQRNPVADSLQE